ncbi:Glycosyltransferase, GT2 family [Paenibacillus tianmuensis]|uniref:Glycosyltransferase, GT2 family n=1 Tax=Paenibacillus tianmuensis TaxID=624147 RepID=A0A1G4RPE0_9BACL|nr:glycosyltransferase [Paenibacillus tianmuensis]SCW58656.1 Glycosyltransferase, GT2 family [Paenibacillus tianmuensis]
MNIKKQIKNLIESFKLEEAYSLILEYEGNWEIDAEILTMKAIISVMKSELGEAEGFLNEALLIDQNYPDVHYNLAYIKQMRGELENAIASYRQAYQLTNSEELKKIIEETIKSLKSDERHHPLVSIVLLAYNNINYTRMCVESIYKYTSHINFEFILVNNGSSDGTKEYFDSLPNARPIHLDQNVGPVNGFNEGMKVAKGKYIACVCNDFIFTPRWMDNLLKCIESDEKIGFVSPGASNISNYQQIVGNYTTIEEMLNFADEYNHTNPLKWEERVRLLPCVLLIRSSIFREIGGYDPQFYFGEFADDDIAFRIRRAGYKLIFCKDTFTYHFGSITTREDQVKNNSFAISRKIFMDKYGLDVWTEASFNAEFIENIKVSTKKVRQSILGINTRCGADPLQLKNKLRNHGIFDVSITNYCIDEKYFFDLTTVSHHVIVGSLNEIAGNLGHVRYDYIVCENNYSNLVNNPSFISSVLEMLNYEGIAGFVVPVTEELIEISKENIGRLFSENGFHITSIILGQESKYVYKYLITIQRGS